MNRFIIVFLFSGIFSFGAMAQSKASAPVEEVLPRSRPKDFPVPPKKDNSLFYIQRNKNTNTIVYDANLQSDGKYDPSKPIDVYWLRYGSTGDRAELSWLQRTFAYGYKAKEDRNVKDSYWATLTAYDGRKIHLEKKDGKPVATMTIKGKYCRLTHIWVYAEETGAWPNVLHVDIHGVDMVTGKPYMERINNN